MGLHTKARIIVNASWAFHAPFGLVKFNKLGTIVHVNFQQICKSSKQKIREIAGGAKIIQFARHSGCVHFNKALTAERDGPRGPNETTAERC
jgi:hypothetical protein